MGHLNFELYMRCHADVKFISISITTKTGDGDGNNGDDDRHGNDDDKAKALTVRRSTISLFSDLCLFFTSAANLDCMIMIMIMNCLDS